MTENIDMKISVPTDRRVTVLRLSDSELSVWLDGKEFGMLPPALWWADGVDLRPIERWLERLVETAFQNVFEHKCTVYPVIPAGSLIPAIKRPK